MSRSDFDVRKIAQLARLHLTEDECVRLGGQFEQILAHIDQLDQLETSQVEPTSHILPLKNVFREDIVRKDSERPDYLSLAPRQDKDHYEVPKIL